MTKPTPNTIVVFARNKIQSIFLNFVQAPLTYTTGLGASLCHQSLSKSNASVQGRLGPGVYLTTFENAMKRASHHGQGEGIIILKCRVNLANLKHMGYAGAPNRGIWPEPFFECLTGMHPISDGMT